MPDPFAGLADVFIATLGNTTALVLDELGQFREVRGIFSRRPFDDMGAVNFETVLHVTDADAAYVRDVSHAAIQIGEQVYRPRVGEPDGKGMTAIRLELTS